MTFVRYLLVFLLLASSLSAQNGKRIHRHSLTDVQYDSEDRTKFKRRRLRADIDSTGIAMYAWEDCYFKINLLERMLINANFYEEGTFNGHPYIKYGNNKFRFRMFIRRDGNFEFDAIIRSRPVNGRFRIPFNIETQGLLFNFQDTLMDFEKLTSNPRADSVIYSYAVRRIDGANTNSTGADGVYRSFGTGKAFHIYRPKVWDNNGDTTWGFVQFNEALTRMAIGVDSAWLHNPARIYPVRIDPTFGNTGIGGTGGGAFGLFLYAFKATTSTDATGGQIDSVNAYIDAHAGSPSNMIWGLYDEDGGDTADAQISVQSSGEAVTTTIPSWQSFKNAFSSISGGLANSTDYFITQLSDEGGSGNIRCPYDNGVSKFIFTTASYPTLPDPWGTAANSSSRDYSVYVSFTVPAAGDEVNSRRRNLLLGEVIDWEAGSKFYEHNNLEIVSNFIDTIIGWF